MPFLLLNLWTKVPPEWVTKPQDEEVVEGQDITLPCKVTGVPPPTVVWRKLAGKLFDVIYSAWKELENRFKLIHNIFSDLPNNLVLLIKLNALAPIFPSLYLATKKGKNKVY
jgi:hypothetical protein